MPAHLSCFNAACRRTFPHHTKSSTTAPSAAACSKPSTTSAGIDPAALKRTWRERRMSNAPLDQSGVWRYRELFPFVDDEAARSSPCAKATRRCSTPRAPPPTADSTRITFKHQGFNPTGSFKDNGMTAGVAQARASA